LGFGYSMTVCIVDEFDQGMEAKLEHDIGSVRLDSSDADFQPRSDLFIRLFPGQ
jgi:hypothetical protein